MPSFRAPTPEQVRAALLKIPTFQLRRAFYERLENPLWVRPLLDAGAFTNPPEPESTGDGYLRDTYWPEVSFLTRIAPQAPDDVVDVLLRLQESNNGWVRRAVFEIGSQIPTDSSVRLEPLIKAWAPTGFGWRTDPRSLVSLSINLLEGGQPRLGRWLANTLFEPRPSDDSKSIRKPELLLEEYWYEEELPRMVPALGENALKALVGWLTAYVKASGHASGDHDFSAMDRSSIDSRGDHTDRPEDALIDAVRDVAVRSLRTDPTGTLNVLLRGGVKLLRKIAIYVVAEAIRQELEAGGDVAALIDAAKQLLEEPESDDEYLRVEYAQLARAAARAEPAATSVVTPFLARAFEVDLAWMRERLPRPESLTDPEWEESVQGRAQRYRHSWLSAIGHDALPADLREELAKLDEAHGPIDDPLEPMGRVTSWSGPNPHTSQDAMAAMAPAELVVHLASWHDKGDGWGPEPSHEGQGRALSGLLTTNPLALRGVRQLGNQLRPTYLRAILQGWEAATKADLELDWAQVAELVEHVLDHPLPSPFPVEGGDFDDDKDYSGAKDAAIGLLEELLKKRGSIVVPDEYEERFARLLIDRSGDEDAWANYDSYSHEGSGWDPLNMSLNWQWPSRVRALIVAATSAVNSPWQDDALTAIEAEASRVDQHGAGRAALGEGLGRLLNAAPDWIKTHLDDLVGTRAGISVEQQIVLTTAMATHRYNRAMYELLTPAMLAAIDVGDALVAGWKEESDPLPRIGEWVIDAFVFGHIDAEDPVFDAFFSKASPEVRGDALGKIAWSFFRASSVDGPIRDRFATLWDDRIRHVREHPSDSKELEGIYWLAKRNSFSSEWWLPRLREALELEPTIATERYIIGKELAQASTTDPAAALAVLKLLLGRRREDGGSAFDLSRHAIPVVIANAMMSPDEDLKSQAEAYMNELGAQGNHSLEGQVQAVLDGRVSVDDVDD
ncbi:hypothetical protein GCM10017576_32160 [Microbacterium barkeri]|uniref:Uncharacterized protein n=1 Tax=Microbacterium barkeri TaxID=33917 RepID=A0A9W6LYA9_9MICO|nr:hypothetical protein [Microbacterium barkeri]MDR6876891.1 hypothetical protein [Microbacterium barkeri]GLJ63085.1 hypothetical protein GCM10017576_32160 [Microbacterium barkeri]